MSREQGGQGWVLAAGAHHASAPALAGSGVQRSEAAHELRAEGMGAHLHGSTGMP